MLRFLNYLFIAIAVTSVATSDAGAAEPINSGRPTHVQHMIRKGDVKMYGVNLGGWLVAESWMSESSDIWLEAAIPGQGEFLAIANAKDPDLVRARFDHFHATFITENDIAEIAAAGLNAVRVPVGYWISGVDNNDPSHKADWKVYSNGTLKYLDRLVMDWADKYNIAVLIDIHAAKGSQNGQDHSSPSVSGAALWETDPSNIDNTIAVVSFLADRYKNQDSFLGIGLLNEPSPNTTKSILYDYYQRAYHAVRDTGNDCILAIDPVLTEQNPGNMSDFMLAPAFRNVFVDWHPYFKWGYDHVTDKDLVEISVKQKFQDKVTQWNAVPNHNPLFFGEWSFATSDRFQNNKELFYEFAAAVVAVVKQAGGGATYWSWAILGDDTTENVWSLRSVLRDERLKAIMFPRPLQ